MNQNSTRAPHPVAIPNADAICTSSQGVDPNEIVALVFVTPHNFMWGERMTRQQASDNIRIWYDIRDKVHRGVATEEERQHLKTGTFAYNVVDMTNKDNDFACWAIGWEHIIGMYVKEYPKPPMVPTPQERIAKIMEKVADVAEKDLKDREEGEEWKEGKGDDEQ